MHRICGVLVGTLPQCPQQNLFLGMPLELMAEEARLLVERGVAFLVDDRARHEAGVQQLREMDRRAYLGELELEGRRAAERQVEKKTDKRLESLKNRATDKQALPSLSSSPSTASFASVPPASRGESIDSFVTAQEENEADNRPPPSPPPAAATSETNRFSAIIPLKITPATTPDILLPQQQQQNHDPSSHHHVSPTPPSYPLYRHLNSLGYYLSPGLRFGCQYMAYPGDPLRFHSHFLVASAGWDEELDLMDLVAGGRLGTGVKKGFLVGGEDEERGDVRTFSLEWAGM